MRAIFLIHLKQVIRDKDWVYPVFLLLLCTVLGQYLAPTDDDPTLVYSTRTQAIWLCAWGCSIFWVSFVAARLGSMQRQNHLRGFWKSLGVPDSDYFFALFAIPNLLNAALFFSAALLSIFAGKQLDAPLGDWILVNLQAAFFAVLAQSIISAVILALTNYLDASPSFACGFLLNLYGMYGIEIVDLARSGSNRGGRGGVGFTLDPRAAPSFRGFHLPSHLFLGRAPSDAVLECLSLLLRHSAAGQLVCAPAVEISRATDMKHDPV